jgi:hypothetical protein
MIDLDDLEDLFDDLDEVGPTVAQLARMHEIFRDDFFHDYVEVEGKEITLKNHKSWVKGFEDLPETFVHLITREPSKGKPRTFDKLRANRIHWVKQILTQRDNPKIKYFEKVDMGYLKKHYWFEEKDFVVILKPVSADLLLVTAFYVEPLKKKDFEWDYNKYRESL